jgi:uncharacterized phage protein gp47/JayE
MPWSTPSLSTVRSLVRDHIRGTLPGADASVPNSVLRVLSDSQGALCHLTLQYVDWLSLMLLPDTAETEWLDRHGNIWLVNSDDSTGRKLASLASGNVDFTGTSGTVVPVNTLLSSAAIGYETTAEITLGGGPTTAPVRALDPGVAGNRNSGDTLAVVSDISGVDSTVTVLDLTGGVDTESDEHLRARILQRIRQPPMGGAAEDYVRWALAVPGVTRAWAATEEGIGTITVRFLMDVLHADDNGWPLNSDTIIVNDYIDKMRPVTVKECYVLAPIKQFIDITITNIVSDVEDVTGAIMDSLYEMLLLKAMPGATIYTAWVSYAIMNAPGVQSFHLVTNDDFVMPSLGHMAVLGTVLFD